MLSEGNVAKTSITKSPPKLKQIPKLDAIELTLILKAAGFRLESFDFKLPRDRRDPEEDLKVEIQCHKSGIVSHLVYKPTECTCPDEEVSHNSSFWEVIGSAPSGATSSKAFIDASSNLLPDLPQPIINLSTTLLQIILLSIKENEDAAAKILKQFTTNLSITPRVTAGNNVNNDAGPNFISPMAGHDLQDDFSTPVSSINVTPMNPEDIIRSTAGQPKVILNSGGQAKIDGDNNLTLTRNISDVSQCSINSDVFTSSPQILTVSDEQLSEASMNLMNVREMINQTLIILNPSSPFDVSNSSNIFNYKNFPMRRNSLSSVGARSAHGVTNSSTTNRLQNIVMKKTSAEVTPVQRINSISKKGTSTGTILKKNPPLRQPLSSGGTGSIKTSTVPSRLNTGTIAQKISQRATEPKKKSSTSLETVSNNVNNISNAKMAYKPKAVSATSNISRASSLSKLPTKN